MFNLWDFMIIDRSRHVKGQCHFLALRCSFPQQPNNATFAIGTILNPLIISGPLTPIHIVLVAPDWKVHDAGLYRTSSYVRGASRFVIWYWFSTTVLYLLS